MMSITFLLIGCAFWPLSASKEYMSIMKYAILLFSLMIGINVNGQGLSDFKLSTALSAGGGKTYGSYCGIAGQHPPMRIAVEELIAEEDLETLVEWLNSPNLVVQTYAAEAFIRLSGKLDISGEIMDDVDIIRNKEENIATCRGCIYDKLTIKECLAGIEPEGKA